MADPNLKQHPNFESAAFHEICEAIMVTLNIDLNQAVEWLITAWDNNHQCRIDEWNVQHQAEAEEMQCQENERREAENATRRQAAEGPRTITENILINRPSQYTTNKLMSCNYIKLWYFSPKGCSNAARNSQSNANDTFGLSSSNDILTLRLVASVKASQNACTDHNLTIGEFLQARATFLHHIKMVPWLEKHINALTMFFWNLESHPQQTTTNGDAIILTYTSCVHQQWHDELKANNGNIFDISIINNTLMNSITFGVNVAAQKKLACRSVRPPPPPLN
ncbi:hypothetical protein BKA82DRAFT_19886 [Pisolithus tinctorius]|uniref:Uncharacterized protein n=1 Tax=Pisolithus tinctorius Marx 270 TaxID=870435 RepID=A0A0C3PTL3_PISTI|nr:hypothetical protein BKA82DRAFT_19886 [Pisolithus tinctorius]KIO12064.1 hypothetical protein M404DRAFT_19886 [Pisolithus tinctorius Marx 270]